MNVKSALLASSSEISTRFYCDNCLITINYVNWKQCDKCKKFDLCRKCADLEDGKLKPMVSEQHENIHREQGIPDKITRESMVPVFVENAEEDWEKHIDEKRDAEFRRIMKNGKIQNDLELTIVMDQLHRKTSSLSLSTVDVSTLNSMVVEYHTPTNDNTICVLSLDGGGVRGYMSIKVIEQLIKDECFTDSDLSHKEDKDLLYQSQLKFTDQFDYFAGTSTGGLIAFCLATKYPLSKIIEIYSKPQGFFKKDWWKKMYGTGWIWNTVSAKYNHEAIHKQIDDIIDQIFKNVDHNQQLTAKTATLFDLHNFLNSHYAGQNTNNSVKRDKVLLINAYNTTTSTITVFNTSFNQHWGYLVADVLKATMAAPTYFQPWSMCKWEKKDGTIVKQDDKNEVFIDGGVFANDPELTALWAIRMLWKKSINYRLLAVGTGCYSPELDESSWGGYWTWLLQVGKPGLVVQTLMDATRSLTEIVVSNLAKFNNIRRMKFNYKLTKSMELDDVEFPNKFDREWVKLVQEDDYRALRYFYRKFIKDRKEKS